MSLKKQKMSLNNLNIQDLENQFDLLLASITEEEVKEWYRFDIEQNKLEKFLGGEFQPTEISEIVYLKDIKKSIPVIEIEVFDYTLNEAC